LDVLFYTLLKENGEHFWFLSLPDQSSFETIYGPKEGAGDIPLVTQDQIARYDP
jgi:hypothetical protein